MTPSPARFISIHNKFINVAAIDYVEFLESGRAMIFMGGLTQEKQNIPVDPGETRRLKAVLEEMLLGEPGNSGNAVPEAYPPAPSSWPASIPALRR